MKDTLREVFAHSLNRTNEKMFARQEMALNVMLQNPQLLNPLLAEWNKGSNLLHFMPLIDERVGIGMKPANVPYQSDKRRGNASKSNRTSRLSHFQRVVDR